LAPVTLARYTSFVFAWTGKRLHCSALSLKLRPLVSPDVIGAAKSALGKARWLAVESGLENSKNKKSGDRSQKTESGISGKWPIPPF